MRKVAVPAFRAEQARPPPGDYRDMVYASKEYANFEEEREKLRRKEEQEKMAHATTSDGRLQALVRDGTDDDAVLAEYVAFPNKLYEFCESYLTHTGGGVFTNNLKAWDGTKRTLVWLAMHNGKYDLVERLLGAGATVSPKFLTDELDIARVLGPSRVGE